MSAAAPSGSPANTFDHGALGSATGAAGPYECASTSGKHVAGNLQGFRFVEESHAATRTRTENRAAPAARRRRDI